MASGAAPGTLADAHDQSQHTSDPPAPTPPSRRVLHVAAGNLYGGVEKVLATVAEFRNSSPDLEHLFAAHFKGRLTKELARSGASVHFLANVRLGRPWTILKARRRLSELLERERIDLVISHSPWCHVIAAPVAARRRVPVVFWLHGFATGTHWLERWARLSPPRLVICNSHCVERTSRFLFPTAPATVIYTPVSERTAAPASSRERIRAELATAPDATVVIQVSRFEEWKGHAQHLEALGRLKDLSGWVCWLVGGAQRSPEFAFAQRLREQADHLGILDRLRFTGERGDVTDLMLAADVFCQPNLGPEPFGIVFIEALRCGIPVVTTAQGGGQEIVNDACGILVPPGDPEALANNLAALIKNPPLRRTLGAAGGARADSLCNPLRQMGVLDIALKDALSRSPDSTTRPSTPTIRFDEPK